jgi:hypothetical protein
VDVEITPGQPESVVAAVVEALQVAEAAPDPWWRAGLAEALET